MRGVLKLFLIIVVLGSLPRSLRPTTFHKGRGRWAITGGMGRAQAARRPTSATEVGALKANWATKGS